MIICQHQIKDEQIIGIGPLMVQYSPEQAMRLLYNEQRLFFHVHMLHHSFKIESEWFQVGRPGDNDEIYIKARKAYDQFQYEYETAKQQVLVFITAKPKSYA